MAVTRISSKISFDSNIYLVQGRINVLIDTGTGLGSQEVLKNIRRILGDSKLDMVILTHCHADHIGGLTDIIESFSCPAFAGKDAEYIRSASPVTLAEEVLGICLQPVDVTEVSDGEIIDMGDHRLRIIDTPGHTIGSISLYDEVTHSLFSGDTLFTMGVGRTDFPTGSFKYLTESLLKLSKIEIKSLYPGHGNVSDQGNQMVRYGLNMLGVSV
ncbi:MAG: MBL fold metallo-hydrolase [Candidatus Methanogranum gryphiswaldense]|nr:MAG: MBL fold metallo-hydrolase [Candidatus Methanogranum sp. U3.2.1]